MPTQGGRGCFVIAGAAVTLVLGLSAHSCCSAVEGRDAGERRLAGKESEECTARTLGSQPDANYDGLGVPWAPVSPWKEVWGLVGVGEVRETGKVTGSDRLEKYTCSPRVHPPCRPKLSGRNCGRHHGNSSS